MKKTRLCFSKLYCIILHSERSVFMYIKLKYVLILLSMVDKNEIR